MKKYKTFLTIFIFYIIFNMILFPSLYIGQTLDGITAWAFNVLPSLLPFIFFTKILSSLGTVEKFSLAFKRPCYHLFKTPPISSYVFFMSMISGYPVGAKMTSDLYTSGQITKSQAFKMSSFCSTSGPMFIIGAVGVGMLKNATYGYIIFISHILGALINGVLYRNLKVKDDKAVDKKIQNTQEFNLSNTVIDSSLSIISVGAIIAIFFVVITSLSPIFNLLPTNVACIFKGLVEITKGCIDISGSMNGALAIISCTFIISFGGLSTIFQSIAMLNKLEQPISLFILQKFTHAIIATIISIIICLLI